ncbi:MAG: glycosyltransferase family 2 protein [Bacteroidetes bacterium]|nr:glycosyltransferase family 2 protein [Bacteroidota bacterium]
MQSWSAGILCYNEAGTIEKVIRDTVAVMARVSGGDFEVFVVDDCSTDNSKSIIEKCALEIPEVKLIHHDVNKGIGEALRSIYRAANKENVVTICGDGQFDVQELLVKTEFDNHEFISFFRLQNTQYNGFRNFLSFFNKWFNKYLLKIFLNDVNWVKAYKTRTIKMLDLQIKSSLVESEICSKLMHSGAKPIEFQSKYLPRIYGVSKGSSWKIVRKAISDLMSLFLVVRKFNKKNGKQLKSVLYSK